MKMLVEENEI